MVDPPSFIKNPLEFNERLVKFYSLTNFASVIPFPSLKHISHRLADIIFQMQKEIGESCFLYTGHCPLGNAAEGHRCEAFWYNITSWDLK